MKTANRLTYFTAALLVSACASTGDGDKANRVPANPPGFAANLPAQPDAAKAFDAERRAMLAKNQQLQSELAELQLLFRLQNAPLDPAPPKPVSAVSVAPVVAPMPAQVAVAPKPLPPAVKQPATAPVTYSALFRFASAVVDDAARSSLSSMQAQLRQAKKVSITAFADTTGDAGLNAKLAAARAAAVQQEILALGVDKRNIVVNAAVADSAPPADAVALGMFRFPPDVGRRVDIALLYAK